MGQINVHNKRALKAMAFSFVVVLSVSTQDAVAGCEDILRNINYDIQKNYSNLTSEQITSASFCSSDYRYASSSERAQVEASYKLLSGSADGSRERIESEQKSRCGSNFGSAFLQRIGISESLIVSNRAIDALEACYKSTSLQLISLNTSNNYFLAQIRWMGVGSIRVFGADVSKLNDGITPVANCKINANGILQDGPFSLSPGLPVTLSCDRVSQTRNLDEKISYTEYPEGIVSLITNASTISIPLVRVADWITPISRISDLERKVRIIESDLNSNQTKLMNSERFANELSNRLSRGKVVIGPPNGPYDTNRNNQTCPENSVAVGFRDTIENWALDQFYCAQIGLEFQ